jgi:uncharacterized protein (TIGR03437 family)
VPFEVSRVAQVRVEGNGRASNAMAIAVTAVGPQILAIANQDGSLNSAENRAQPGSAITIYATGLGQTTPGGVDGLVNSRPLPVPVSPVTVTIQGQTTPTLPQFVAGAAGLVAGITQIDVMVPAGPFSGTAVNLFLNATQATLYVAQ